MRTMSDGTGKSVRLIIRGRVQGVFYRASACERARALGLGGYVKNLPDRSVEAVAEGTAAAVDAFVEWCRVGPPRARVDEVVVSAWDRADGTAVRGFDVR